MLLYRGLSQIGEWNMRDIDQILRGLDICKMANDREKSKRLERWTSFINYEENATYEELILYGEIINSISKFLRDIRRPDYKGIQEYDNPPVCFKVVGKTVHIYPGDGNNKQTSFLEMKAVIGLRIKELGKGYKLVCHEKEKLLIGGEEDTTI